MPRVRIAAAVLALATALTAVGGLSARAATTVTASAAVNVRSGPSTTSAIVGGLYRGQTTTAVRSADGWTAIRYAGRLAYVASRYLVSGTATPAPDPGQSARVTTTDLNLRRGPGLSYAVITVLRNGTRVILTGKSARGFVEVRAGSTTGWVSAQYLASAATGLPKVVGVRVATADLLIRTTAGADYKVVAEVKKGTELSITGATQNGRAQIIYQRAVRWVTARYLANPVATKPGVPALPKVVGYRYATTELLIRSTSTSSYRVIAEVPTGTKLAITGVTENGRAQVVYNAAVRWVTARYLSTSAPPPSGGSGSGYAVERGLQPNAIKVHRAARAAFPEITTYYGVRQDPIPDHPSGRALDLMIPNYTSSSGRALGTRVAEWARANHASLGIEYVIWNQRIWNVRRDSEGWRYMADRGGDSANHKNHVHITVFG